MRTLLPGSSRGPRPAAQPSFNTNSGLIGPRRPGHGSRRFRNSACPSAPLCSAASVTANQRPRSAMLNGRPDVVDPDDRGTPLDRQHRGGEAAVEALTGGAPLAGPDHRLARQPTSTGTPKAVRRRNPRSRARLCARVLPKPKPGSTSRRPPGSAARRPRAARQEARHLGDHVPIARILLHGARLACMCIRQTGTPSAAAAASAPGRRRRPHR